MALCPEAACAILESFYGRIYHQTGTSQKVAEDQKDSIVVSIPACHAGDRGSIPRRGAMILKPKNLTLSLPAIIV